MTLKELCTKCFHPVLDHNTLGVCQTVFCKCHNEKIKDTENRVNIQSDFLCVRCRHPKEQHSKGFQCGAFACICDKYTNNHLPDEPADIKFSTKVEDSRVSIQKGNEVTHQDLEPNVVRIFTKGDQIEFSVQCKRFDMEMCIEETVEAYNKLAKALGKKEVHLNQIIGAPIVEEHQSFKEKYKVDDDFEQRHAGVKIRDKNPKAFHNRLRKYRLEKGVTLISLCEKLNFDPRNYAEIEKGLLNSSNISEDQLLEISSILNLDDSRYNKLAASHKL